MFRPIPSIMRSFHRSLCLFFLLATPGFAEVTLPKVIGDHMVLQQGNPVPIWGKAAPRESVTVTFGKQKKQTTADAKGEWRVNLDALPASAEPKELIISGKNEIRLQDILVGEVWLCSGQSNMEMAVGIDTAGAKAVAPGDEDLQKDLASEGVPGIRLFKVQKKVQGDDVVSNGWSESKGPALAEFSAAGYIFGHRLHDELKVPIGLIQAAWGGTRIEGWTPLEAYQNSSSFKETLTQTPGVIDGETPGKYYGGMIRPLAPFRLRGVIWYQGEANVLIGDSSTRYADKVNTMLTQWRKIWEQPDLPFYQAQLACYGYSLRTKDPIQHAPTALPEIWEAQRLVTAIPHTGVIPTSDLSHNYKNIHPKEKRPVGERFAQLALAQTYGQTKLIASGPVFDAAKVEGGSISLAFKNIGGGLKSSDGKPLTHFEIAGVDGVYQPAEATIKGNIISLSSTAVPAPATARFGWHESAYPNLTNTEGLPVYPFRTDAPKWSPATK